VNIYAYSQYILVGLQMLVKLLLQTEEELTFGDRTDLTVEKLAS